MHSVPSAFIAIGTVVNQEVQGWGLRSVDLLGHLCVALGAFLLALSLVGLCAARSGSMLPLFAYFIFLLVLLSGMLLTGVYAYVENSRMRRFLELNWSEIQARLGVTGEEGEEYITFEEAVALMHRYLIYIGGAGVTAVLVLGIGFVAAMRQLGIHAIAVSLLVTLGLLGVVEVGVAYQTRGHVPPATTSLLLVCAAVQVFCASTGICGFRWLNCECLFWSCLALVFSAAGLTYTTTATYFWLVVEEVEEPQSLLLVFGISLVADFMMVSTLVFMLALYCKRRGAFMQADHAYDIHGEFSDYATREGTRGGRGRKRKKLPVSEISVSHNHL